MQLIDPRRTRGIPVQGGHVAPGCRLDPSISVMPALDIEDERDDLSKVMITDEQRAILGFATPHEHKCRRPS